MLLQAVDRPPAAQGHRGRDRGDAGQQQAGLAQCSEDRLVTAGLDAPIITGTNLPIRPELHLGVEKMVGPLALRLGTQQLGFSSFYTAGAGIMSRWFQLNLGLGVDNPANIKGAAGSLNLGIGF